MPRVTVEIATCSDRALNWIVFCLIQKAFGNGDFAESLAADLIERRGDSFNSDIAMHVIERYIHTLIKRDGFWMAECYDLDEKHPNRFCYEGRGPSATIAALRAFAHSRLGSTVSIPQEFV